MNGEVLKRRRNRQTGQTKTSREWPLRQGAMLIISHDIPVLAVNLQWIAFRRSRWRCSLGPHSLFLPAIMYVVAGHGRVRATDFQVVAY